MKLFDDRERSDKKVALHSDSTYSFYNRSALKQAGKVRDLLNLWFENYPLPERKELKRRFEVTFMDAFYELFLHELFRKQGFELFPHPSIPDSSNKPEFLVSGNGVEFYLEAKIVTDKNDSERTLDNVWHRIYDSINAIESNDFKLLFNNVEIKKGRQPKIKKLKYFIHREILKQKNSISYGQDSESKINDLKNIVYEDDDIVLDFDLLPYEKGSTTVKPFIWSEPPKSFIGGVEDAIKSAFSEKAKKYGKLDKPYLLCLNSISEKGTPDYDIKNLILGSEVINILHNKSTKKNIYHSSRKSDGIFSNSTGPKYTSVSAVMINQINDGNICETKYWLVKHPYARQEFPHEKIQLKSNVIQDGMLKLNEGKKIEEILEIPDNWYEPYEFDWD